MFGGRRTGGPGFNAGRLSTAVTPTKRFTDFGIGSTRKSEAAGRLSMSQGPRPSFFTKGSTVPPRDVKSLQAANVQKIYNFLVEQDGSDAPSESSIRSPGGGKDFKMIFESMYQHLSKDYEFPLNARIEDEVMPIFKGLGYPFSLKTSFFQPMGGPHGWPHLLDALAWLVDVIRMNLAVSVDTQNILFGDFLDHQKVQEKALSYMWYSTLFRDYTNDRKAAEDKDGVFWKEAKANLRQYFENSNEYEEMITNLRNVLQQLRFDCDEIEAEKGQEQTYVEDIARMKDDIRKAVEYLESTQRVKENKEAEVTSIKQELEMKNAEMEKCLGMVYELKERIEHQKQVHGCSGKEVRQMNLENSKDKETVSELQAELDEISKETWRLKNDDSFKEQKAKFVQLVENINKLLAGLDVKLNLDPLSVPSDEKQLKAGWETLNSVWIPEISRQMHQRKLELETDKARFVDKFAAAEERIQIENEMLCEAKKKEGRDERIQRIEREEWKVGRQQLEKRYDELENEREVLTKKMQMDGSLEKEIKEEKDKMAKMESEAEAKSQEVQAAIREKLEEMLVEIAEIGQEKYMFHVEATEVSRLISGMCSLDS